MTAVVDLHSDLLLDVGFRRLKGETGVVRRRHLEPLRRAGVRVQVLAAWTDNEAPPSAALPAALRLFEHARREEEESDGAFRPVFLGAGDVPERLADHHAALVRAGGAELPACGADLVAFLPQMPAVPPATFLPPDADGGLARQPEPERERAYADLVEALARRGEAREQVAATLGGNALAFLRRLLG